MLASEALIDVQTILDDAGFVHADPATALRMLNRAYQAVSIREGLLRETHAVELVPDVPLYRLSLVFPRFVAPVSADIDGIPVWPVALEDIRYGDPQWLATTAGDQPQWIYPLGLLWFGLYPVPVIEQTLQVTAVVAPEDLLTPNDPLVIPDAYLSAIIQVCAGFLVIASEKAYQQGMAWVARGLRVKRVMPAKG
jgi:hypothetical protein